MKNSNKNNQNEPKKNNLPKKLKALRLVSEKELSKYILIIQSQPKFILVFNIIYIYIYLTDISNTMYIANIHYRYKNNNIVIN